MRSYFGISHRRIELNEENKLNVFEQLKIDEGIKYEVYKDHLGYPTFGVGHLVTESDPEHGKDVGFEVSEERVWEVFQQDLQSKYCLWKRIIMLVFAAVVFKI